MRFVAIFRAITNLLYFRAIYLGDFDAICGDFKVNRSK